MENTKGVLIVLAATAALMFIVSFWILLAEYLFVSTLAKLIFAVAPIILIPIIVALHMDLRND